MVIAVTSDVFGSSESFDGTQPLYPLRLYPDPLAGLVTGESSAGADAMPGRYDDAFVPVAKPVEVDRESAMALMEAAFSDEDDGLIGSRPKMSTTESSAAGQAFLPAQRGRQRPPSGRALPGMLPAPDRRPAGQRVRQALRSYPQRSQVAKPEPAAEGRYKSSRSTSGVVVALILIAVFGFIAFQVLAGIIEAISSVVE